MRFKELKEDAYKRPESDKHFDRNQLPQIRRSHIKDSPFNYKEGTISLDKIKPVQSQRVAGLVKKSHDVFTKNADRPFIIDKDNYLINGHHRYDAAHQLGISKVKVIKIDATIEDVMDHFSHTASDKEVMAAKLQDKIKKRLDAEAGGGGGGGAGGGGAGAGGSGAGASAGASAGGDGGSTGSSGDGGSADSGDTGSSDSAPTSDAPVSRGFGFYGIGTYSPGRKKKKKKKKKSFAYGKGIYEAISEPIVAKCGLEHTEGKIGVGHFLFKQEPGKPILLVGRVTGLTPGKHGFHIHEFGDLSDGCKSAGGHYNPDGVDHGDIDKGHAGDLGNIVADENGTAEVSLVLKRVDLFGDRNIIGRAIVVHADEDDLGKGGDAESLKTGNAGDRLGCGVIRLATLEESYGVPDYSTMPAYKLKKASKGKHKFFVPSNEPTPKGVKALENEFDENFADGKKKGKSRPGRVKKAGASCKGSVSSLRAKAKKYSGERGKMYHWCANMKAGRNK